MFLFLVTRHTREIRRQTQLSLFTKTAHDVNASDGIMVSLRATATISAHGVLLNGMVSKRTRNVSQSDESAILGVLAGSCRCNRCESCTVHALMASNVLIRSGGASLSECLHISATNHVRWDIPGL